MSQELGRTVCVKRALRSFAWGTVMGQTPKSPLAPTIGGEGQGEGAKSRRFARELRRRQTDCERVLWRQLRARQLHYAKFRRQHPIGPYIVDLCCPAYRLVVEVDGGHHAMQIPADEQRTAFLMRRGYRVLRFWDHDVLGNREAVLQAIEEALSHPHPSPLPLGGRGEDKATQTTSRSVRERGR